MTWDDALRVANVTGCAFALWLLSTAAFRQWREWNNKTRDHWLALTVWVFIGFEGPIESIIQGNPPGPRTVLQTLAVALTLRALLRQEQLSASPAIPWKEKN